MFDIIPFPLENQRNEEGWLAGWCILSVKYRKGDRFYPWYVEVFNLYNHEINHWAVPTIFDTWQYSFWAD